MIGIITMSRALGFITLIGIICIIVGVFGIGIGSVSPVDLFMIGVFLIANVWLFVAWLYVIDDRKILGYGIVAAPVFFLYLLYYNFDVDIAMVSLIVAPIVAYLLIGLFFVWIKILGFFYMPLYEIYVWIMVNIFGYVQYVDLDD